MILSNTEIRKALADGRLVIEPPPSFPTLAGGHNSFDTTSVNLRLGASISIPDRGAFAFDLQNGKIADSLTKSSKGVAIDKVGGWNLSPGTFILGQTKERVKLPLDLAARVEGKSSLARCGLLIHFAAPTIHADFGGHIRHRSGINAPSLNWSRLVVPVDRGVLSGDRERSKLLVGVSDPCLIAGDIQLVPSP